MKRPNSCISCGTAIPAGFIEASCPACLMELGVHEESAEEFRAGGEDDDEGPAGETSSAEYGSGGSRDEDRARRTARTNHSADQTVGHYRLVEKIGEGGMGVVWSAKDTRLGRTVAIKFLPADVARQSERLARFKREAQLLAALNHPHISAIYGLEWDAGGCFLVLEYVEGDGLDAYLQRGALPMEKALKIASQIALGLSAAHERKILHRDLKPANIKLTREGKVKVLDFGLAKALLPAGGTENSDDLANQETRTALPTVSLETGKHVIVGTAPYMSPEQASADRLVDRRTDIWAFGCVLYEMLTGARAFDGNSVATTIRAIQSLDPDWSRLPKRTPETIRRLLARCLEKAPERRLRDAADVHLEIMEALSEKKWTHPPAPDPSPWRPITMALLGLPAALAAGVVFVWWLVPNRPDPNPALLGQRDGIIEAPPGPLAHIQVQLPEGVAIPSTITDETRALALSPDGRSLVFSTSKLYIRPVNEEKPRPLHTGAAQVGESGVLRALPPLLFSPKGDWLAFTLEGQGLFKMRLAGGEPVLLTDKFQSSGRSAGAWGPEGTIVVGTAFSGLMRIPEGGGDPVPLTDPDGGTHSQPVFLPGGKVILFASFNLARSRIEALDLETGKQRVLIEPGSDPHYVNTGHLVFLRESSLMAVRFDPGTVQLLGEPVVLRKDIAYNWVHHFGQMDVSPNGNLAFIEDDDLRPSRPLLRVQRDGTSEPFTVEKRDWGGVRLSRDGRWMTGWLNGDGSSIFVSETERFFPVPLSLESHAGAPLISPDGSRLALTMAIDGPYNVYTAPRSRPEDVERLTTNRGTQCLSSWSPDGRYLTYRQVNPLEQERSECYAVDLDGDQTPRLLAPRGNGFCGEVSRDSKWIAYAGSARGHTEIFIERFPEGGDRRQVSNGGGRHVRWSPDTDELFYSWGEKFFAVGVRTEPEPTIGEPRVLFDRPMWNSKSCYVSHAIGPGAEWFLVIGPDETPPPSEIQMALGWSQKLVERVGR